MWWYFVKLKETETIITYAYGFESKQTTGIFEYDKTKTEKMVTIIKYADNHKESKDIQYTAYKLVTKYGNLEKKIIAYG